MGSVRRIIEPQALRPELIAAVERGIERTLERARDGTGVADAVAR